MPIIQEPEQLDYLKLLEEYSLHKGKEFKPVKHRVNSSIPQDICCPRCNAPSSYLYDNTGGRGQFKCKVCSCNFNLKNLYSKDIVFKCSHCLKTLEKIKNRKDFIIFKCKNDECSFYQHNLKTMSKEDKAKFQLAPHNFKIRYIFRQFNFNYKPLSKSSPVLPSVDISKIYSSPHTLGLILTYHVNYGISARKTAALMKDVHGLKVSHQTVLNYANSVACLVVFCQDIGQVKSRNSPSLII